MNGVADEDEFIENTIYSCEEEVCTISFKNDFKDFHNFFSEYCGIHEVISIDLSNLKIKPNNLKGMFAGCEYLEEI